MTTLSTVKRVLCRSGIITVNNYFAGVALNKSNTVIMKEIHGSLHIGELQIVMEKLITYRIIE